MTLKIDSIEDIDLQEQYERLSGILDQTLVEVLQGKVSQKDLDKVGDDISKLELTSLLLVKYINALQENSGISEIDLVEILKNNVIGSKHKTIKYILTLGQSDMVSGVI